MQKQERLEGNYRDYCSCRRDEEVFGRLGIGIQQRPEQELRGARQKGHRQSISRQEGICQEDSRQAVGQEKGDRQKGQEVILRSRRENRRLCSFSSLARDYFRPSDFFRFLQNVSAFPSGS